MNIYTVRSSCQKPNRSYPSHHSDNVLAEGIDEALSYVKTLRPASTIWTISHKGTMDAVMVTPRARRAIMEAHSGDLDPT